MTEGNQDPQGQQAQGTGDPQITYQLTIVPNEAKYELDPNGTEVEPDVYEYPSGTFVLVTIKNLPHGKKLVGDTEAELLLDKDVEHVVTLENELPEPTPVSQQSPKVTLTVVPNGATYTLSPPGDKVGEDEWEFDEGTEVIVECNIPPLGERLAGYRFAWDGGVVQSVDMIQPLSLPQLNVSATVGLVFVPEVPVVSPTTPPEDNEPSLSDLPKLDDLDGEDDDLDGWSPVSTPNTGSEEDQQPSATAPVGNDKPGSEYQPKRELKAGIGSNKLNPWVVGIGVGCGCLSVLALLFTMMFVGGIAYYKLSQPATQTIQQQAPAATQTAPPEEASPVIDPNKFPRPGHPTMGLQDFNPYIRRTPAEEEIEALRRENAEIKEDLGEILEALRQQAPQQPN